MSNIFWHDEWDNSSRHYDRYNALLNAHPKHAAIFYSICRSGRRWFWDVEDLTRWDPFPFLIEHRWDRHGRADTQHDAIAAARAAAAQLAGERPTVVWLNPGHARKTLKKINADKRRPQQLIDLAKLKQEMANAHPDRGGTSAAFLKAHQQYFNARRKMARG
jgi:hypothetical protein